MAAERILKFSDDLEVVFSERSAVPEWRSTLLFLFAGKVETTRPDWGSRLLGRLLDTEPQAAVRANPAPAVFIAEALDLILAKNRPVPDTVREAFIRLVLDAIEDEVALPARQVLGLTLGRLGDPRIFDLHDPRAYVEVPAGTYPHGEDGGTVEIATPFWIGRYPVTNSQYRAFTDDGGYRNREWWSDAGWSWLQAGKWWSDASTHRLLEEGITAPSYWRDPRWNGPNQPVVGVSFWEADACCAWAAGRLPREQEWEAAARGPEGCEYPWCGDWEEGICNTIEVGLRLTSPVGLFPRSRQFQLGIQDLAGNVLDWCGTVYQGRDNLGHSAEDGRVVRGGSWLGGRTYIRGSHRYGASAGYRGYDVGFRVVRSSRVSTA